MNVKFVDIPKIEDYRGNIGVIEKDVVPFEIKRVYYIYDIPSTAYRGAHAHKKQTEFLVALSGSFDVMINDGEQVLKVSLNKPDKGLLIQTNIWRELDNFSSGAVCLVLSSGYYDEDDYIREYDDFLNFVK